MAIIVSKTKTKKERESTTRKEDLEKFRLSSKLISGQEWWQDTAAALVNYNFSKKTESKNKVENETREQACNTILL